MCRSGALRHTRLLALLLLTAPSCPSLWACGSNRGAVSCLMGQLARGAVALSSPLSLPSWPPFSSRRSAWPNPLLREAQSSRRSAACVAACSSPNSQPSTGSRRRRRLHAVPPAAGDNNTGTAITPRTGYTINDIEQGREMAIDRRATFGSFGVVADGQCGCWVLVSRSTGQCAVAGTVCVVSRQLGARRDACQHAVSRPSALHLFLGKSCCRAAPPPPPTPTHAASCRRWRQHHPLPHAAQRAGSTVSLQHPGLLSDGPHMGMSLPLQALHRCGPGLPPKLCPNLPHPPWPPFRCNTCPPAAAPPPSSPTTTSGVASSVIATACACRYRLTVRPGAAPWRGQAGTITPLRSSTAG